jgi:hypothetical protein
LVIAPPAAMGEETVLITHPVAVHGYTMRVSVDRERLADFGVTDRAAVTLFQKRGGSVQSYEWSNRRSFRRFTVSRDGRSAELSVGFAGAARLDMSFRARGSRSRGRVPWCEGRNSRIAGRLTGNFVLRTGTKHFGKVVRHRLNAWLVRGREFLSCAPPYPLTSELFQPEISVSTPRGEVQIIDDGATTEEVLDKILPHHQHQIFARSRQQHFFYRPDFSSARATGIGPYFKGALSYTATPGQSFDNPAAFGPGTKGTVSGHFGVGLAAPGPFTITKGRAMLLREEP